MEIRVTRPFNSVFLSLLTSMVGGPDYFIIMHTCFTKIDEFDSPL